MNAGIPITRYPGMPFTGSGIGPGVSSSNPYEELGRLGITPEMVAAVQRGSTEEFVELYTQQAQNKRSQGGGMSGGYREYRGYGGAHRGAASPGLDRQTGLIIDRLFDAMDRVFKDNETIDYMMGVDNDELITMLDIISRNRANFRNKTLPQWLYTLDSGRRETYIEKVTDAVIESQDPYLIADSLHAIFTQVASSWDMDSYHITTAQRILDSMNGDNNLFLDVFAAFKENKTQYYGHKDLEDWSKQVGWWSSKNHWFFKELNLTERINTAIASYEPAEEDSRGVSELAEFVEDLNSGQKEELLEILREALGKKENPPW